MKEKFFKPKNSFAKIFLHFFIHWMFIKAATVNLFSNIVSVIKMAKYSILTLIELILDT